MERYGIFCVLVVCDLRPEIVGNWMIDGWATDIQGVVKNVLILLSVIDNICHPVDVDVGVVCLVVASAAEDILHFYLSPNKTIVVVSVIISFDLYSYYHYDC